MEYFSATLDRVTHRGILYKLGSVGIGGSVLSLWTQFLSNRSEHVLADGCRSELVNAVLGVPEGSVLGPLLFVLYTSELFSILENKLIGYVDDSTLMTFCHPQAPELQWQSPRTVTSAGLVSGVTFGG